MKLKTKLNLKLKLAIFALFCLEPYLFLLEKSLYKDKSLLQTNPEKLLHDTDNKFLSKLSSNKILHDEISQLLNNYFKQKQNTIYSEKQNLRTSEEKKIRVRLKNYFINFNQYKLIHLKCQLRYIELNALTLNTVRFPKSLEVDNNLEIQALKSLEDLLNVL
jgi:hypothetical protein